MEGFLRCEFGGLIHGGLIFRILRYFVVQFYPWFKFIFLCFGGMVMYDNKFETKENQI